MLICPRKFQLLVTSSPRIHHWWDFLMTWHSPARKKVTFNCFRHSFFAPTQPSIHPALSLSSYQRPSAPYLCVLGFCRWQNEFDSIWIFLFGKNPLPLPLALSLPCLSVTHSPVTHTQSYRVFFHWSRSKSSSKRNWSHPIKKHCQRHYGPRHWLLWTVILV